MGKKDAVAEKEKAVLDTNKGKPQKGDKQPKKGKKIRVYKPNPLLDNILTVVFLIEVALCFYTFRDAEGFVAFTLSLVGTAVAVVVVKKVSVVVGDLVWKVMRHTDENPLSKPLNRKKFAEQAWQLAIHVSMAAGDCYVMSDETWWEDTRTMYEYLPPKWSLKYLYIIQLAVWVYTCFIHRFMDERRKDYFVMYIHHVATICLVWGSLATNHHVPGLIVLVVHDISDVTVDLLKMFNYLDLGGARAFFLTEIMFVLNLIQWIYWRLYQFPFRVLRGTFIHAHLMNCAPDPNAGNPFKKLVGFGSDCRIDFYYAANFLMFVLQGLHIWWFFLFLRLAYNLIKKGTKQAGREGYEGDSD